MAVPDISAVLNAHYSTPTKNAITFIEDKILINPQVIVHRNNGVVIGKSFILDQLGKNYQGQHIIVISTDGEDLKFSGFDNYLKWCCKTLNIPANKITYVTHPYHDIDLDFEVNQQIVELGIFEKSGQHLPVIQKDLANAKFIGYTIGRFTIPRMRLAYELDKIFANDSYCEFSEIVLPDHTNNIWEFCDNNYQDEIQWLRTKQFVPQHLDWYAGLWEYSLKQYDQIWNQFKIEIVVETNALTNYFFTEKTARCLASGKPFVLFSGERSLDNLHRMGFNTYGSVIDESYDTALHPYQRVQMMVKSLQELYQSPDREQKIQEMYTIADENKLLYKNTFSCHD